MERVCVFCGSRPGASPVYMGAARRLARALVDSKITLVYGGAKNGLMGAIADEALRVGGDVIGVIPNLLVEREVAHSGLTELRVTESMHERKHLLSELSDAFIALPGGVGTLEELFEAWTWSYLGLHSNPCGVLNTDGYYDTLLHFLDETKAAQFIDPAHRDTLVVDESPHDLVSRLAAVARQGAASRPETRPERST